ncbi:hypothetical protein BDV95DRAFT_564715 [Massariosphaeria phaeospora]|uniref:Uncharacterized protein n=1 Tax=Massariosphaeria phaeospora TaxID=100035 RepID=A0A7C8MCQ6_9PLEO|nr:hypothetical protein BDV95DRAFT_564715 [Massariosphaeria phaeospora]
MDIVKERKALRVLVILYPQSPLYADSKMNTIRRQALTELNAIGADARTLFLATWPHRTIMVFDLCNGNYDFAQAHHPEDLPVVAIHFQTNEKVKIGIVSQQKKCEINNDVARYHKLHGYGALPMVEDHRNGNVPTYMNPRDMVSTA